MIKYLSAALASLLIVGSQSAFSQGCPCFNEAMILGVCKNLEPGLNPDNENELQCNGEIRPSWYYSVGSTGEGISFCKTELVLDPENPKQIAYAEFDGFSEVDISCQTEWGNATDKLPLPLE